MYVRRHLVLLAICGVVLFSLFSCSEDVSKLENQETSISSDRSHLKEPSQHSKTKQNCQNLSIKFTQVNNQGNDDERGANYVIIFDPKSKELDFKVSVALSHKLYAKDAKGKFRKDYVPKQFHEIIADENAKLNGKAPIAAINSDYIDPENRPQGLNISRGVEYSGAFKDKRSSFGISGGRPEARRATIQKGRRNEKNLNYNVVGGNGRFYQNGRFKNICNDLGEYACQRETSRSMVAIASKGHVILLVNDSSSEQALYPDKFDDVLEGIARNHCLGKIQEGMLFDGGFSTGLYFDNKIYVEHANPIGSVFLIYRTR